MSQTITDALMIEIKPSINDADWTSTAAELKNRAAAMSTEISQEISDYEGDSAIAPVYDLIKTPLSNFASSLTRITDELDKLSTVTLSGLKTTEEREKTVSKMARLQQELYQMNAVSHIAFNKGSGNMSYKNVASLGTSIQSDMLDYLNKMLPDFKSIAGNGSYGDIVHRLQMGRITSVYEGIMRQMESKFGDQGKAALSQYWSSVGKVLMNPKTTTEWKNLFGNPQQDDVRTFEDFLPGFMKGFNGTTSKISPFHPKGKSSVLTSENFKQISSLIMNDKRVFDAALRAQVVRQVNGGTLEPYNIDASALNDLAKELYKGFFETVRGTSDAARLDPYHPVDADEGRTIRNRAKGERAQAYLQGLTMLEGILQQGDSAFGNTYASPSGRRLKRVTPARMGDRYEIEEIDLRKLTSGDPVKTRNAAKKIALQESDATRMISRYGTALMNGDSTDSIVYLSIPDYDSNSQEDQDMVSKVASQKGYMINGKNYIMVNQKREGSGPRFTMLRQDIKEATEEMWAEQVKDNLLANQTTKALYERGAALYGRAGKTNAEIEAMAPRDRSAYTLYDSVYNKRLWSSFSDTSFNGPLTAKDRIKQQDVNRKIFSPSTRVATPNDNFRVAVVPSEVVGMHDGVGYMSSYYLPLDTQARFLNGSGKGVLMGIEGTDSSIHSGLKKAGLLDADGKLMVGDKYGNNKRDISQYSGIITYDQLKSAGLLSIIEGLTPTEADDVVTTLFKNTSINAMTRAVDEGSAKRIGVQEMGYLKPTAKMIEENVKYLQSLGSLGGDPDRILKEVFRSENGDELARQGFALQERAQKENTKEATDAYLAWGNSNDVQSRVRAYVKAQRRYATQGAFIAPNEGDLALDTLANRMMGTSLTVAAIHGLDPYRGRIKDEHASDYQDNVSYVKEKMPELFDEAMSKANGSMIDNLYDNTSRLSREEQKEALVADALLMTEKYGWDPTVHNARMTNGKVNAATLFAKVDRNKFGGFDEQMRRRSMSNVELMEEFYPQILKDAVRAMKETGLDPEIRAQAIDQTSGKTMDEQLKNLAAELFLGDNVVWDTQTASSTEALHRSPSSFGDNAKVKNAAYILRGMKNFSEDGKYHKKSQGARSLYSDLFGHDSIGTSVNIYGDTGGSDEDGDIVQVATGEFAEMINQGVSQTQAIRSTISKVYSKAQLETKKKAFQEGSPDSSEDEIVQAVNRGLQSQIMMGIASGMSSRMAQFGLTESDLVSGDLEKRARINMMMKASQAYTDATTSVKTGLGFDLSPEEWAIYNSGAEYEKVASRIGEALSASRSDATEIITDPDGQKKRVMKDGYWQASNGRYINTKALKFLDIDKSNLPSVYSVGTLANMMALNPGDADPSDLEAIREYYLGGQEGSVGFESAVGDESKKFIAMKRDMLLQFATGSMTASFVENQLKSLEAQREKAETELDEYIRKNSDKDARGNLLQTVNGVNRKAFKNKKMRDWGFNILDNANQFAYTKDNILNMLTKSDYLNQDQRTMLSRLALDMDEKEFAGLFTGAASSASSMPNANTSTGAPNLPKGTNHTSVKRKDRFTAHQGSVLMGYSNWSTPLQVLAEKYGWRQPDVQEGSAQDLAMKAGTYLEQEILDYYGKNMLAPGETVDDIVGVYGNAHQKATSGKDRKKEEEAIIKASGRNVFEGGRTLKNTVNGDVTFPVGSLFSGRWDGVVKNAAGKISRFAEIKTISEKQWEQMFGANPGGEMFEPSQGALWDNIIQAALYSSMAGFDSFDLIYRKVTDAEKEEINKELKDPSHKAKINATDASNTKKLHYDMNSLMIPLRDLNGELERDSSGAVKQIAAKDLMAEIMSRNISLNQLIAIPKFNGTKSADTTRNELDAAKYLTDLLGINIEGYLPNARMNGLNQSKADTASKMGIVSGDVKSIIEGFTQALGDESLRQEDRQALGEAGKALIDKASNFNANMRKKINYNKDESFADRFFRSSQYEVDEANAQYKIFTEDEHIKKTLESLRAQGKASGFESLLNRMEEEIANMGANRVSSAIAQTQAAVQNVVTGLNETIKGNTGTEKQKAALDQIKNSTKNAQDWISGLNREALSAALNMSPEQARMMNDVAHQQQTILDAMQPRISEANARIIGEGIDSLEMTIGKRTMSPEVLAGKQVDNLQNRIAAQAGLALQTFKESGHSDLDKKNAYEQLTRLMGTRWQTMTDDELASVVNGDADYRALFGRAENGGLMKEAMTSYEDSIKTNGIYRQFMQGRSVNRQERSLRNTLLGKVATPEQQASLARENAEDTMKANLMGIQDRYGTGSEEYKSAIRQYLGENAGEAEAQAFIRGTLTEDQKKTLGGDYSFLDSYQQRIYDQQAMTRKHQMTQLSMLDMQEKMENMKYSPFANTWGSKVRMETMRRRMTAVQKQQRREQLQMQLKGYGISDTNQGSIVDLGKIQGKEMAESTKATQSEIDAATSRLDKIKTREDEEKEQAENIEKLKTAIAEENKAQARVDELNKQKDANGNKIKEIENKYKKDELERYMNGTFKPRDAQKKEDFKKYKALNEEKGNLENQIKAAKQTVQNLADARNVKLAPFKDVEDKTKKMNGEAGAKYQFSRRDDEARKNGGTQRTQEVSAVGGIGRNGNEARNSLDSVTDAATRAKSSVSQIGVAFSMMSQSAVTALSRITKMQLSRWLRQVLRQTIQFVQQWDAAMTTIQTITMKSDEEMETISQQSMQQAIDLKASSSDIATIKADLYRQGLSDDEVNERTESIVKFSKVTGIKSADASKIVATAMNTGLEDSASRVMDVLTALGDSAATTADQIQKGIQKAGASAKVSGVSYEELATLMTIGTANTQLSGQQIGTSLQTIFSRMNRLEESDYIADINGENVSVNDVESALKLVGVSLRDDEGNFRGSFEVLKELAGVWQDMNDTQKSLVTNAMAGSRQSNIFQTLMEGMSEDGGAEMERLLGLAENSDGTTESKYEIATKSLATSLTLLQTSWEAVVEAVMSSDFMTFLLDSLDQVSEFLQQIADLINNGQGLSVGLTAIGAAIAGIAAAVLLASGPIGWLVGIVTAITGIGLLNSSYQGVNTAATLKTNKQNAANRIENVQANASRRETAIEKAKSLNEEYNSLTTNEEKLAFETKYTDEFNAAINDICLEIPDMVSAFENAKLGSNELAEALGDAAEKAKEKEVEEEKGQFVEAKADATTLASATKSLFESENKIISYMNDETGRKDGLASLQSWEDLTTTQGKKIATYALEDDATAETYFNTVKSLKDNKGNYLYYQVVDAYNKAHPTETVDATSLDSFKQVMNWVNATNYEQMQEEDYHNLFSVARYQTGDGRNTYYDKLKRNYELDTGSTQGNLSDEEYFHNMVDYYNDGSAKTGSEVLRIVADKNGMGNFMVRNATTASAMITASEMLRKADYAMFGTSGEYPYYLAPLNIAKYESENPGSVYLNNQTGQYELQTGQNTKYRWSFDSNGRMVLYRKGSGDDSFSRVDNYSTLPYDEETAEIFGATAGESSNAIANIGSSVVDYLIENFMSNIDTEKLEASGVTQSELKSAALSRIKLAMEEQGYYNSSTGLWNINASNAALVGNAINDILYNPFIGGGVAEGIDSFLPYLSSGANLPYAIDTDLLSDLFKGQEKDEKGYQYLDGQLGTGRKYRYKKNADGDIIFERSTDGGVTYEAVPLTQDTAYEDDLKGIQKVDTEMITQKTLANNAVYQNLGTNALQTTTDKGWYNISLAKEAVNNADFSNVNSLDTLMDALDQEFTASNGYTYKLSDVIGSAQTTDVSGTATAIYNWMNTDAGMQALATPEGQQFVKDAFNGMSLTNKYNVAAVEPLLRKMIDDNLSVDEAQASEENVPLIGLIKTWLGDETFAKWQSGSISTGNVLTSLYGKQIGANSNNVSTNEKAQEIIEGFAGTNTESATAAKTLREYSDNLADQKFWLDYWDLGVDTAVAREALGIDKTISHEAADVQVQALKDSLTDGRTELYNGIITALLAGDEANALELIKGQTVTMELIQTLIENGYTNLAQTLATVVGATFDGNGNITLADVKGDVAGNMGTVLSDKTTKASVSLANSQKELAELQKLKKQRQHPIFGNNYYTTELDKQISDLETEIADEQSKVDLLTLADEYERDNAFGDSTSEVVSYIRSMAEGTSNVSEAQAALAKLRSSASDFSIDEGLAGTTVQAIIASSADSSGSLNAVVGFMNTEKGKAWVRKNGDYWENVINGTDQAINEAALAPLFDYLQENPDFSATELESDYTYGGLMQLLASYLGDENYQLFKQGKLSLKEIQNLLYASGFSANVGNGSNRTNVAEILNQLASGDVSQYNSALESIRSYTASEADWEYYADLWDQGVTSDSVKEALGFSKNDSNEVITNAIKNKRIEKDAERQQYYGEIFKAMKGYGLIGSSEQERTTAEVAAELRLSNEEGAADMAEFLEGIEGTIDENGNLIVSDIYSDQTNAETLLQDEISAAQVRRANLEPGTKAYEQADRQVRLLQTAQNISKDYMTYGNQASTISGYMQGLGGTDIERATALGNISTITSEAADKQAYIDLWRMGVRTKTVKNALGVSEDMDEKTANAMVNAVEASQYAENKNIYEGLVNNYANSVMTEEQKESFFSGSLDEDKIQWLRNNGFEDLATILSGVSGSFENGSFVFGSVSGDEKATGEAREDSLTYWTEKLAQAEEGTQEFAKAQAMVKGLQLEEDIDELNEYGENTEHVAETLADLAKGGKNAANVISSLTNNVVDLQNQQWALNTIQKGWNKEAGETLGITEDQYKIMEQGGILDNYIEGLQEGLNEDVASTLFDPLTEAIQKGINAGTVTEDFVVKFNTSLEDGTLDTDEIQDLIQSTEDEAVQTLLASFGDTTVFSIAWELVDTLFGKSLKRVTSAQTGGKKKSGGGGGGGKSAAETLIDEQKKEKTLYEHMVKMVQYQQTKYQNADELGNYGLMIEKEIEVEKKRLPVIQKNIEKLKEQIATVAEGSDDWYSLRDAILEAEEEYEEVNNTIDENVKKLEENQQAIYKLRTDLEDTVKEEIENRKSEEEDMLSGSVSMQETILEAIKQRYQDEWDLVKKDIEKKKQALEEEKSLIDERLQKRKDAADEQEKYEELAEYKKQLALISMDSTRTKDAAELREKIADLEEEIGWDIAEAEAEQQTNALQDEIDAYDDYETEGDEKLEDYLNDANNFADEVNSVLKMTQEEMFNWMKTNVQDYVLSLNDAQLQMVKSWEDTYKQMYGIVDTYWSEINGVLTSKDTFLNYMKNSSDYINASEESRAQMLYNWEEAYDNWAAAQKKDADYAHSDDYGEGSYSLPYNTPHYDWNETLNEIATSAVQGYNATANAQLQALKGTTLQSGVTLTQTQAKQLKALLNASSYVQTPNFSTVDTAGYGNNNSINIDEIQIVVNEASFADEDDYDAFALKVGDAFVKQLSKRGITTANYSF